MLMRTAARLAAAALAAALMLGQPARAEKLTLGSSVQSLFSLPLYLAKEKGYFAEEGLDIDIVNFSGGATATPALLGGSIVLQSAATENLLKVIHAGQPLVAVMVVQSTMNGGIIVPTDLEKKLGHKPTLDDLKGLRFGILARGGMADMVMRYIGKEKGLSAEGDFTLMPMGQDGYGPAMLAGDLDAAQTVEPLQTLLTSTGKFTYMLDMLKGEGPALFQDMGWITLQGKRDWIAANKDTVRRIVRAMVKAQKFAADKSNIDEVVTLMQRVFPNIPAEALKVSIARQSHTYVPDVTKEAIAKSNELVVSTGQLAEAVPYEKVVDTSFSDLWEAYHKD